MREFMRDICRAGNSEERERKFREAGLRAARRAGVEVMDSYAFTNTPEAQANQLEWARQQMALEVPEETLEGAKIGDRADLSGTPYPNEAQRKSSAVLIALC